MFLMYTIANLHLLPRFDSCATTSHNTFLCQNLCPRPVAVAGRTVLLLCHTVTPISNNPPICSKPSRVTTAEQSVEIPQYHPFSLSKRWFCSLVPTHKPRTTALGRRSRPCTAQEVLHMLNKKQAKPRMPAVFSSSSVRIRVEGVSIWVHRGWYSTDL